MALGVKYWGSQVSKERYDVSGNGCVYHWADVPLENGHLEEVVLGVIESQAPGALWVIRRASNKSDILAPSLSET